MQFHVIYSYYLTIWWQGTPIHAEIAAALAVDKGSMIEIEKVYELKRFRVTPSRNYFKPVDNNFMIQFTLYTQAKVVKDPPQVFPRYIYKLTCFENIEDNIDNRTYLIGKKHFDKLKYTHLGYKDIHIVYK
jgi:hypothetical protein